jgi:L-rhamnose isomerase
MGYASARDIFRQWGVDSDAAIDTVLATPVSVHCWQGDDVVGFEGGKAASGGGILATGNHPGRARTPDELRADVNFALGLIPGRHRLNLHAMYPDTDDVPDRDALEYRHFEPWVDWAKEQRIGLDFNPTFFAHEKAGDNLALSHPDEGIRTFWIEHGRRCREIAERMGEELCSRVVNNIWVPDGFKDTPADRMSARRRLEDSLDAMLDKPRDAAHLRDAVESKLFGIGVEACTVGSHEFYLGYAIRRQTMLCLDMGHFHPTESVADKLSAIALSVDEMLLHASRPMRWDSDHVIVANDDLMAVAQELVSADLLDRTRLGLDFFDATISRTAAWVLGTRSLQKALLRALLMPLERLRAAEDAFDFTARLAITEEARDLPYAVVWSALCERADCPEGLPLIAELERYQSLVVGRG